MATARFQPTSLNPLLNLVGIPHGKFVVTRRGSGFFGFLDLNDEDTGEFVTIDEAFEMLMKAEIPSSKIDGHTAELRDCGIPQSMGELIGRICACEYAATGDLILAPVTGVMWPLPFMRVKSRGGLDGTIINTVVEAYNEALSQTRAGNCTAYDGINMVKAAMSHGLPLDEAEYWARYDAIPTNLRELFDSFSRQMATMFMTYAANHVRGIPFLGMLGTDSDTAMLVVTCDSRQLLQAMPNPGQMAQDLQAHLEATAVQPATTVAPVAATEPAPTADEGPADEPVERPTPPDAD